MQLFVHITNNVDSITPILKKLMEANFKGATTVDCEGMLHAINEDMVDAPSIFGGLRKFVNPDREKNKMLMMVMEDEHISQAIEIIESVEGDLNLPNNGIIFTLPITRWEGVIRNK